MEDVRYEFFRTNAEMMEEWMDVWDGFQVMWLGGICKRMINARRADETARHFNIDEQLLFVLHNHHTATDLMDF